MLKKSASAPALTARPLVMSTQPPKPVDASLPLVKVDASAAAVRDRSRAASASRSRLMVALVMPPSALIPNASCTSHRRQ